MPTYEYICDACGNEFEEFQSMSAAPVKKCPKCKKNKVHRKISTGGGIIFKGGGFYETDYRNDAYNKAAAADKPAEVKTETAGAKIGAESAPAAEKSDAKPVTSESKTSTTQPSAPSKKSSGAKKK